MEKRFGHGSHLGVCRVVWKSHILLLRLTELLRVEKSDEQNIKERTGFQLSPKSCFSTHLNPVASFEAI